LCPRAALPAMRGWAISPDFALRLAGLIGELRPKTILELGSGASTIVSAYCLERLGSGTVISLDQEQSCAESTIAALRLHNLSPFARVIHAELRSVGAEGSCTWYDSASVDEVRDIDLLIVDGPAVETAEGRYPALPLLYHRLSPNAVILIDDADRELERAVVAQWLEEFPELACERFPDEKGAVVLKRRT
jgi:predicted O-methyltransferase YrrM